MGARHEARPLTAREFCARVVPALSDREAENGLPFGIAQRLAARPELARDAVLLAIEEGAAIVAAAVWTPPHDIVVTRLPAGAAAVVAEHFAALSTPITGVSGPADSGREVAELLARRRAAPLRLRSRQRIYELTAVNDVPLAPGAMRGASPLDHDVVRSWYSAFVREVDLAHPADASEWASAGIAACDVFLWEDGAPRSLACLSRETPHGRAIGPVYTPREARRHGFATSLVAELARSTLASGKRFACLFTDAANPTSNHIYESIGFVFVCPFDAYSLGPPGVVR
jgi:uncharacterized protein